MSADTGVLTSFNAYSDTESTVKKEQIVAGTRFADATDEQLLLLVAKGDKSSLAILFQRYGASVRNVASRILHDQSEAMDVRQDVFIYLYERAHLFDPSKSSAGSWIIQVTYHRALSRRRYLSIRKHYDYEQLGEGHGCFQRVPGIIDGVNARFLIRKLEVELTEMQRMVVQLHIFEGYSFREIAGIINETPGNVRNHYYRGIERLRSIVFSNKSPR